MSMKTKSKFPEARSEEHTSELQSRENLVCRLLLEKKKKIRMTEVAAQEKKTSAVDSSAALTFTCRRTISAASSGNRSYLSFVHRYSFFFLLIRRPPISTLFPYTTLFR